ncbi:hypothetical protein BT69DRAFT_1337520 [Atractiella rhizophila]|nr:hypothetical protein BT69DRAFT_1337520 [Atractiella rhizophila]
MEARFVSHFRVCSGSRASSPLLSSASAVGSFVRYLLPVPLAPYIKFPKSSAVPLPVVPPRRHLHHSPARTATATSRSFLSEPGISPHRLPSSSSFPEHSPITIEVWDYSKTRVEYSLLTNKEFIDWIRKEKGDWVKARVINVRGGSWDVLRAAAIAYDFHPLAIEDTLDTSSTYPPKVEFYPQHLFLELPLHTRACPPTSRSKHESIFSSIFDNSHTAISPTTLAASEEDEKAFSSLLDTHGSPHAYSVPIRTSLLNLFQTPSNTLLIFSPSLSPSADSDRLSPVLKTRLEDEKSLLRESEDVSMVLQNIVDICTDHALDLVRTFGDRLTHFESGGLSPSSVFLSFNPKQEGKADVIVDGAWMFGRSVLLKPEARTVRQLHLLSAQLVALKRSLEPLLSVVQRLQGHERELARLHYNQVHYPRQQRNANPSSTSIEPSRLSSSTAEKEVEGKFFVSEQTRVYLNDVKDHLEACLSSIELFRMLAKNLVDFNFNMISYHSSQSMRTLTLVSVVFLPLSFWTSYYGMNFDVFPNVTDEGSHVLNFWKTAIPTVLGFVVLLNAGRMRMKLLEGRARWRARQRRGEERKM